MPQPWTKYLLIALLVWLLALVATQAPLFLGAPEPSDSAYHLMAVLSAAAAGATLVLGFALGWMAHTSSIVRCALYGALVLTTAEFLLTNWVPSGGEPAFPMPINFLIALVINGVSIGALLGLGALAGVGARRFGSPRTAHRMP